MCCGWRNTQMKMMYTHEKHHETSVPVPEALKSDDVFVHSIIKWWWKQKTTTTTSNSTQQNNSSSCRLCISALCFVYCISNEYIFRRVMCLCVCMWDICPYNIHEKCFSINARYVFLSYLYDTYTYMCINVAYTNVLHIYKAYIMVDFPKEQSYIKPIWLPFSLQYYARFSSIFTTISPRKSAKIHVNYHVNDIYVC